MQIQRFPSLSPDRRMLLRHGASALLSFLGTLAPLRSFARATAAFDARSSREALDALLGGRRPDKSDRIKITAAELAESGAVVPVSVETDLAGIESISFLAPENPRPLALSLRPSPRISLPVTFRVKLAKTQDVSVVVRANGKEYSASRQIRVVVGGCIGT